MSSNVHGSIPTTKALPFAAHVASLDLATLTEAFHGRCSMSMASLTFWSVLCSSTHYYNFTHCQRFPVGILVLPYIHWPFRLSSEIRGKAYNPSTLTFYMLETPASRGQCQSLLLAQAVATLQWPLNTWMDENRGALS